MRTREVTRVDLSSGEVTRCPDLLHARHAHASTATSSEVFVFGGHDGEHHLASCEVFNPEGGR